MLVDDLYKLGLNMKWGYTYHHMPRLLEYAQKCEYITEFGTGLAPHKVDGHDKPMVSLFGLYTWLKARPRKITTYDICFDPTIRFPYQAALEANIELVFHQLACIGYDHKDIEQILIPETIEKTDLLFIDSNHTYNQLTAELTNHAEKVSKYIIMHDTEAFAYGTSWGSMEQHHGKDLGLATALDEFLLVHDEWEYTLYDKASAGLSILTRKM